MADDLTKTLELVQRAQGGDRGALDRIMDRYYDRVRRIVRVRLGPALRNVVDSGDIIQETFLTAHARFDHFAARDEGSLINWLAKLAEHKITDAAQFHRAQKRDLRRKVAFDPQDSKCGVPEPEDDSPSPPELAERAEETQFVDECVHELDSASRELILLRAYAKASWATVAEETGRPSEDAARVAYSMAVVRLGRLMKRRVAADPS